MLFMLKEIYNLKDSTSSLIKFYSEIQHSKALYHTSIILIRNNFRT